MERGIVAGEIRVNELIWQTEISEKVLAFYLKKLNNGVPVPVSGRNMYGFKVGYKIIKGKPADYRIILRDLNIVGSRNWEIPIKVGIKGSKKVLELSQEEYDLIESFARSDFNMSVIKSAR